MWSWPVRQTPERARADFWKKAGTLPETESDEQVSDRLSGLARALHPRMSVRVRRGRRGRRLLVLQGNADPDALREALLLYRRADRAHRGAVIHEHTPAEWMQLGYEMNRDFFESVSVGTVNWAAQPAFGAVCLSVLDNATTCRHVGRLDLAAQWHAAAGALISECSEWMGRKGDEVALEGAYVALAQRVWLVTAGDATIEGPKDALRVPFEAYRREIDSLAPGWEMDCAALICCLQAVLDRDPRGFEVGVALIRKREPDTSGERRLAREAKCLLDGAGDGEFWDRFRAVLLRWLDPVVFTESEAQLFSQPLRHALALTWLDRHHAGHGPDAYLRVLRGD